MISVVVIVERVDATHAEHERFIKQRRTYSETVGASQIMDEMVTPALEGIRK